MRRFVPSFVGAGLLATGLLGYFSTGCGLACNAVGPRCGVEIALAPAVWEPGSYVFEVDAGKETYRCEGQLPFGDEAAMNCDPRALELSRYGPSTPTEDGYPGGFFLWREPQKMTVRVFYQGNEAASKTFKPKYKGSEPNGEGCGMCWNAAVTMDF